MNTIRQFGIVILLCLFVNVLWGKGDILNFEKTLFSYSIKEGEQKGFFEKSIISLKEEVVTKVVVSTNKNIFQSLNTVLYRPEVCQLSVSVAQNGCTDNNNGTFTANYDANVSWIDGPAEAIQIIVNGTVAQTISSGSTSPQIVPITLSADGTGQDTIIVAFSTTTSCSDTLIIKSLNPCPSDFPACATATGCLGGNAFDDFNRNGTDDSNESGIQGVQVVVYDCNNAAVDTVWTDSDGEWQVCSLTDGEAYRVEFIIPESIACWANPSNVGTDNGTDIQFLTVPACTKFGLSNPNDYAEEDPYIIIPCFSDGTYNGANSGEPAIVKLKESADGHDFTGTAKTAGFEAVTLADHGDVGAVYGVAWQSIKERYYLSAFHKRYVDYGPDGPDAIYQYDLNGNKTGTINLDAILATANSTGSDVHDFTPAGITDPHPGEIYDLGVGDISFDAVGKQAFGDIEISSDNNTLYVVNLFDKKIYALDISSGNTANTTIVQSWDTPDETNAGRNRPFALASHEGKLWIGSVDENGSNAYVHSLLPTTNTFNLELTIPLGYDRQAYINDAYDPFSLSNWNAWATTADVPYGGITGGDLWEIGYPQPILSDIEFADNGDMILGFRDRFGDQSGAGRFLHPAETQESFSISAGDILKACLQSGNYVLETAGGSCAGAGGISPSGPGGTEFYSWDFYNYQDPWSPIKPFPNDNTPGYVSGGIHWETTQGALLQIKGNPYIITTAMDPFSDYSGGLLKLNNTTGGREGVSIDSANLADLVGGYTLFDTGEFPPTLGNVSFGKANGLGDLEAATKPAPLEIGNYVWCDSIINGIQDACEVGISDIIVQLFDRNGLLVGQDTTVNGAYYFNQNNVDTTGINVTGSGVATPTTSWSGMSFNTQYFIVFGGGQFATDEFTVGGETYGITPLVNAGTNDNIDSDVDGAGLTSGGLGARPDGLPFIDITTSDNGIAVHGYDLGVICVEYDYGDLPDLASGTSGILDYETLEANGGPSHEIIDGLFLGAIVDGDIDGVPDTLAVGDDDKDGNDDEDGVTIYPSLDISPGVTVKLPLSVTNTTGDVAHVEAWIDWNGDGKFDGPNEMVANFMDAADGNFPSSIDVTVPANALTGSLLGFRVRLSNTDNMTPYGRVNSGEVEDYLIGIDCPQVICLPATIELIKK